MPEHPATPRPTPPPTQPSTDLPSPPATTSPHVPEHLAGWYAGDLAWARRAHAEHVPAPAAARPDEDEATDEHQDAPAQDGAAEDDGPAEHEEAPPEGGRFLAAWYAGDLGAAVQAHRAHERDGADPVRLGRTTG